MKGTKLSPWLFFLQNIFLYISNQYIYSIINQCNSFEFTNFIDFQLNLGKRAFSNNFFFMKNKKKFFASKIHYKNSFVIINKFLLKNYLKNTQKLSKFMLIK